MKLKVETAVVGDQKSRAAERMLERKRMGLESAIEALETVGYAVSVDSEGHYAVTPPSADELQDTTNAAGEPPATVPKPRAFLEGYPDLLTPAHLAELTGLTVQYTRKLCRDGYLPAVQIGESRWHVPKKRFIDMVLDKNDDSETNDTD